MRDGPVEVISGDQLEAHPRLEFERRKFLRKLTGVLRQCRFAGRRSPRKPGTRRPIGGSTADRQIELPCYACSVQCKRATGSEVSNVFQGHAFDMLELALKQSITSPDKFAVSKNFCQMFGKCWLVFGGVGTRKRRLWVESEKKEKSGGCHQEKTQCRRSAFGGSRWRAAAKNVLEKDYALHRGRDNHLSGTSDCTAAYPLEKSRN